MQRNILEISPLFHFLSSWQKAVQLGMFSQWKWAKSKGKWYQGTHCGWSLYKVPSTPTVICKCSTPRSSLFFSTIAASPAPQSWAALFETAPHTSFTMMLSSHVLSRPSCCRIRRTWRRASRSLHRGKHMPQQGIRGSFGRHANESLTAETLTWFKGNGTTSPTPTLSNCFKADSSLNSD